MITAAITERLRAAVGRYGAVGAVVRAARLAAWAAGRALYLRERHVWYRLDLGSPRPRFDLRPGLELMRAGAADLPLLEQLETVGRAEAQRRLAGGADLWMVRNGNDALFACWIFRGRMPVLAAPGGWLALPARTVGMEDSIANPRYRGTGVAPAAWSTLADHLARAGVAAIVTKVEEQNTPCRRSIEKAGFRIVAGMYLRRICMRPRVQMTAHDTPPSCAFLLESLGPEMTRRRVRRSWVS
ncbi:MAG: GNAT family N-acetyltransferase [Sulfurifustis sp.]